MKLRILIIGKPVKKYIQEGIAEYLKMISRYQRIEIQTIGEEQVKNGKSIIEILKKEGERLLAKLTDRDYVIALDMNGEAFSSVKMANFMQERFNHTNHNIIFIIGGPHGLDAQVKNRADFKLSLSKMTFPHELCLLILLEQLYRSLNISSGGKYHK